MAPIPIRAADSTSVSHILDLTKAGTVCVSKYTFPLILEMLETGLLKHLKTVICFDSDIDPDLRERGSHNPNARLILWSELLEHGKRALGKLTRQVPNLDTQCLICFTSGSTGLPKGTISTHGNLICSPFSG